jgi:hypothetical protein
MQRPKTTASGIYIRPQMLGELLNFFEIVVKVLRHGALGHLIDGCRKPGGQFAQLRRFRLPALRLQGAISERSFFESFSIFFKLSFMSLGITPLVT